MFENLPAELLQYIFMFLSPCVDFPNVLLVCKRWHSVCKEVIRLRKEKCSSAFKLESPLRWTLLKVGTSAQFNPSKRFGSTVLFRESSVYVFGGATSMFTTFNDLWVYHLQTQTWKRLPCGGELPAPRAQAKGAFIGDSLYLFGGCHSLHHTGGNPLGQIHWLNDLKRFDTKSLRWSAIPLRLSDTDLIQSPPVNAGQSGCFLPESPDGLPSLLVLFGGISQRLGACVSSLCFVNPIQGRWYTEEDTNYIHTPSPSGRCGHAVCALDPYRMIVLFGNRAPMTSSEAQPSDERVPVNGEDGRSYQGHPAADIWILTRFHHSQPDLSSTTWYWSKVQCFVNLPGCPPIDFYHTTVIHLPYSDKTQNDEHSTDSDSRIACTVLCVSQCTDSLLEEAARQRRYLRRSKSVSCDAQLQSATENHCNVSKRGRTESYNCSSQPCCSTDSLSAPAELNTLPQTNRSDSLTAVRRAVDRRAKRLEALAAQERRLFGSRSTSRSDQEVNSSSDTRTCPDEPLLVKNPVAVYSLRLLLPSIADSAAAVLGTWLVPRKLSYLDLVHGPHDCLGFSCAFGTGCLFLFGGLCESDEFVANSNQDPQYTADSHVNHLHLSHEVHEPYEISLKYPPSNRLKSSPRSASFYALQPQELVGTVV